MNNQKRDQQIEEQYNQFMEDVMSEDYEGDFSEYGFEQPTPEIELSFTDISEETTFTTETPAPVDAIIEKIEEIVQNQIYGFDDFKGLGEMFDEKLILHDVDYISRRVDLVQHLGATIENAVNSIKDFFEGINLKGVDWNVVAEKYFDIDSIATGMDIE